MARNSLKWWAIQNKYSTKWRTCWYKALLFSNGFYVVKNIDFDGSGYSKPLYRLFGETPVEIHKAHDSVTI